jgi:hypothetical protein
MRVGRATKRFSDSLESAKSVSDRATNVGTPAVAAQISLIHPPAVTFHLVFRLSIGFPMVKFFGE